MLRLDFLHTRVARRILLLFLVCTILPTVLLSGLGYAYVASELESGARKDLRVASKTAGMMIIDRLNSLAARIETLSEALGTGGTGLPGVLPAARGSRFTALVLRRADGSLRTLRGTLDAPLPALRGRQAEHIRGDGTALVVDDGPPGPQSAVYMVHAIPGRPGEELWGLIDPASVWSSEPSSSPFPAGTEACLTMDARPLACATPGLLAAVRRDEENATFAWSVGDRDYLAGHWTIFLGRMFAAPSWDLTLSAPATEVYAPLGSLRHLFLVGLVLALVTTFVLSHVFLRRSMEPLEALQQGTERVATGDFDARVAIQSDDEFGAVADSFNRMASHLGRQFRTMDALRLVHHAALSGEGGALVLQEILGAGDALIAGAGAAIALARPDDPFWWNVSTTCSEGPRDVRPPPGELEELRSHPDGFVARRGERARSYFARPDEVLPVEHLVMPLLRSGNIDGAMVVRCRPEQEGRAGSLAELAVAADQVAVAIANTQLVEQLNAMNWGALTALARTIDAVSPWTAGHSERVTRTAMEIARRLGRPADELDLLHRGGLLHDIGKVGVPVSILDKPASLTPDELARVRGHPSIGARILAPIGAFRRALPLVLHHHELLDGSGYPHGLAGEQIPLLVRILTVADVYDALSSDRPYRSAWTRERAVAFLQDNAGTKFDPTAVKALAEAIAGGWSPGLAPLVGEQADGSVSRFSLWPEPGSTARRPGPAAPAVSA